MEQHDLRLGFMFISLTTKVDTPKNIFFFIESRIHHLIEGRDLDEIIPKDWALDLFIVPNDDVDEVKIMGPSRNRFEKYISYGIHFPAKILARSKNPDELFIQLFFTVFIPFSKEKLRISEEDMVKIRNETWERFFPPSGALSWNKCSIEY